jgi:capsular exopolysaccharide synthesis family protein
MPQDPNLPQNTSSNGGNGKANNHSLSMGSGISGNGNYPVLGNALGVASPGGAPGNLQIIPLPYYASPNESGQEEEFNLRQFLSTLRRRISVVSGVAIVVTLVSWVNALNQRPVYQGSFRILIEDIWSNKTADGLLSPSSQSFAGGDVSGRMATQIEVLRSPAILKPIHAQLIKDYPDLSYDDLEGNLKVEPFDATKVLSVTYEGTDPVVVQGILDAVANAYLIYSSQQQQNALKQGIDFVQTQLPALQERVDQKQKELQAFRQQYSLIDPESLGSALSGLLNSLRAQQQTTQTELVEAQSLYTLLQRQVGTSPDAALASAALSESGSYQKLLGEVGELESKLASESARFKENAPQIQALIDRRSNLVQLLEIEAQRILGGLSNSGLNDRMTSIPLDLTKQLVSVTNQIQVLQVRTGALVAAERQLKEEFSLIPQLSRQYTDLQRELQIATESLNRFLATRENLQIEASQKSEPWQLIAEPLASGDPVSPGLSQNLLGGALVGLALGIAAGLIRDRFDHVFHSVEELKEAVKLPILGLIPHQKDLEVPSAPGNSPVPPAFAAPLGLGVSETSSAAGFPYNKSSNGYSNSPFQESFRVLYSNLKFLSSDTPIRSVSISSSLPGDGKSTVSLYLAQAAAAMGQRVLVVDADMRRPQLHQRLGLNNMRGLSNILANGLAPDDVIHLADVDLSVLTAGQIPPDPTKLLSSHRMASLIEQFEASFDLVIYDTPPLLGLADASLLATHTDGLVLVVGLGKTDRSALTNVLDNLKLSAVPILGLIANGINQSSNYSNGYYYYQSYYNRPAPSTGESVSLAAHSNN